MISKIALLSSGAVLVSIDRDLKISSFEGSAQVARAISRPDSANETSPVEIGAHLTTLWDDSRLLEGIKQILDGSKVRASIQV